MAEHGSPIRTAFVANRVFDGERVLAGQAVVVDGGRITEVVSPSSLPPDVPVVSEPGCTLMPGLIDIHMHFMRWMGPLFPAYGVTTVRDTGNPLGWVLPWRAEAPGRPWPRILCTGPLLDGPVPLHPHVSRACKDLDDAAAAVRETAAAGVDGIKLYNRLDADWLRPMVDEAHAAGLKVCIHCQHFGVLQAGEAGVEEFFHLDGLLADIRGDKPPGWLDYWGTPEFSQTADRQARVADEIAALGMAATPTLAYWDSQWRLRTPTHVYSEELQHVPTDLIRWQAPPPNRTLQARWREALAAAQRFIGLLLEREVTVLAGSDTPCGPIAPGASLWRELSLLVGAGMSPAAVLRAATAEAGRFLGHPELGRLAPGAIADMAFIRGNPLDAIPDPPDVALVVQSGLIRRPEDLLVDAADAELDEGEPWAVQFREHWRGRP